MMFKSAYTFSVLLLVSFVQMQAMEKKCSKKKSPTAGDRQLTVDIPSASAVADHGLVMPLLRANAGADESKIQSPELAAVDGQRSAEASVASSLTNLKIEEKAVATLAAVAAQREDDVVVYHKPSIFTRISDSWYGADTNVIAEIESGTFDYRDRGAAAHRIEWAINESIKKDAPQGLRTIVDFCKQNEIEINRDFLTRARKFLKKKNREEFVEINKFFDAQSEQIRSNKKALKQLEVLYGASYGSSDEENYDSTDKMVAKMKEAKAQ